MSEKTYAFVDSKCPKCNGEGLTQVAPNCRGMKMCDYCHGTGLVGEYREVPNIEFPFMDGIGPKLREIREQRKASMRELAELFDCGVSHVSDIERGIVEPTEEETRKITEWMDGE